MPRPAGGLTARSIVAAAVVILGCGGAFSQFAGDAGGHPSDDYRRAAELFASGRRDEAVGWFYRGQLRYRVHLAARPDLPRDGDPALFASLSETVGRPLNEYAFGDIPALVRTLDRVLSWQAVHEDQFTSKARFGPAHARTRAGLVEMRNGILAGQEDIRRERARNGLPNR